jgi:hypothetical protein
VASLQCRHWHRFPQQPSLPAQFAPVREVLFWGNVDAGTALIDRHPDARFISKTSLFAHGAHRPSSRLGVNGTSGSNPLSSSAESIANPVFYKSVAQ